MGRWRDWGARAGTVKGTGAVMVLGAGAPGHAGAGDGGGHWGAGAGDGGRDWGGDWG